MALVLAGLLGTSTALFAKAVPIVPDGEFRDWKKSGKPAVDPTGDATTGGIDFDRVWIANDDDALHLRLKIDREVLLQDDSTSFGNRIRLYLDIDAKANTGLPIEGLGAEIEVRFGEQELIRYDKAGNGTNESPGLGTAMSFPTFSSNVFEVRVEVPPWNKKKRRKMRLVLGEGVTNGDRLPDQGVLTYKFPKKKRIPPLQPTSFERGKPEHLRILGLNSEQSTISSRQDLYRRLIGAIAPDILAFQEVSLWSAQRTEDFIADTLPTPESGDWWSAQVADTIVVSAFPVLASASVDANLVVHIDLPDEQTPHDLVLFNAHLPCCDNNTDRDREVDNLMATWRDLLTGVGPFQIDPNDAVVITGDFNLVGFRRQFNALVNGTFIGDDHGDDFAPGRDNGSLAVAPLRHSHRRMAYTWRRETSSFGPGRLDFVFFSDDVATLEKSFVVDTDSMPAATLEELSLEQGDSLLVSDHLPLVVDLSFAEEN